MFAVSTLSAGWQTFLYAVALVLFVLGGIGVRLPSQQLRLDCLGLAFFVFVFFWNALAAT